MLDWSRYDEDYGLIPVTPSGSDDDCSFGEDEGEYIYEYTQPLPSYPEAHSFDYDGNQPGLWNRTTRNEPAAWLGLSLQE